jgi:peptide/nickel transport system substrate-binding protein
MRKHRTAIVVLIAGLLALGVAACGSTSSSSSGSPSGSGTGTGTGTTSTPSIPLKPGENPVGQQLYGKTKGGKLTVYSSEDFEHLDPGSAYFALDYQVIYATQRPLLSYPPNSSTELAPDLATAVPTSSNGGITDGGKTITVHIQPNVKFSPPINRVVTSKDVAYAIERGANPNVGNGYFAPYFGDIVGADKAKGGPISGIQTPNNTTIVFHLTKPTSGVLIGALSMPLSSPVPAEMAGPMDKKSPTTYGADAEVATGPYMIKANSKGVFAGIGYQSGKSLTLVRNPNWDASTYSSASFKPPAYLDEIDINIGGSTSVIGTQTLKGTHALQMDTPSQPVVKEAYEQYPSQITFTPGAGDHYGGFDTAHGVFTNVNLRRAVWAAMDRNAVVKLRGGPLVAQPMTHFITPGTSGYDEAGGAAGPNFPWNKNPNGDPQEAATLMKAAGYPSGKYTGSQTVQIVGSENGDDPQINQIVNTALTSLGFKTHLSQVDQSVMYSKYCGVPKQEIDICPSAGWIRDFNNPLTVLYVPFNGAAIVPTNNSNWSQLNDPAINSAMNKAELITDPTAAAKAWGAIDTQLVNLAVALPEEWDTQPNIESKDVAGVDDLWNIGSWDFMFTSLK